MKKLYFEVAGVVVIVVFLTLTFYGNLIQVTSFWNSQFLWSSVLSIGWIVVALGYYNQGWIIHENKSSKNVSVVLPVAVLIVQCVLFIKGIFYHDWSLIAGAVMVNSGVLFNLYQIYKTRHANHYSNSIISHIKM
ncbi:MAG: hypothetical protein QG669_511 [Patescibacteria group bacterium]|jgi:hypothetical protein|nr:hypothetical protein [Patescibacteria group bacterium]MDQ5962118.1 hypothetical protein [Patescibacteria group bacterium]